MKVRLFLARIEMLRFAGLLFSLILAHVPISVMATACVEKVLLLGTDFEDRVVQDSDL